MTDKRNYRLCSLLLVLLLICGIGSVGIIPAYADSTDNGYTYIADSVKKTAQITGYTGKSLMLDIPSKIDNYTVTSIKAEAFKGKSTLLTVSIPDTVTTIGSECFSGCTLLNTITLGKAVSTIGAKAFQDCRVLTSLSIPASVSSIGAQSFTGCRALSRIIVDNNNLVYTNQDDDILYNKLRTSLICYPAAHSGKSFPVPKSVNIIDSYAFEGAKSLTEIDTSSVVTIREGAFKNCAALEKIRISSKVTKLEKELFSGCKKLSALSMPPTISSIGENTFKDCTSISAIIIPDAVTAVGAGAFSGCTGVKTVTIGKGLSVLSGVAFRGCTSLTEYKLSNNDAFSIQDGGVLFSKDSTRLVAYPAGKTNTTYTVGSKVTTIGVYAFDSCTHLKKLIVPATVKTLADPVIADCGNTVIYVDDGSAAMKYFKSNTKGYSALKIGEDPDKDDPGTTPEPGAAKIGDVSGDGNIDNADVILLRRYIAKWKNVNVDKTAADVNKDGTIDNADAILLRRYVAGWKNAKLG